MTMSKIHIKYMTDEALETLKANTSVITERLTENQTSSTRLSEFMPSELYVTKKYEIEEFTLRVPKDEKDRETDIYNSILLYERLHHLPLYVLTDERFWCWMNFEMGYEVALKYMPVKKNSSVFKDHWLLTQGKRRGLFFGVLSRCYFRVALSVDNTLDDPYELTKFVIENVDNMTLVNTRKAMLVNSSIEEEIALLPGTASGTPVSGSLAIPK